MSKRRASSRRAKKERNQTLKKTFLFFFIALGLFLLFVFGIIPLSLKILDLMDRGTTLNIASDKIPPSAPNISVPFVATNSAQIKINGFTEPESKLVVFLNGRREAELTVGEDGQFETKVSLAEGENEIVAKAYDKASNESQPSEVKKVIYDSEPPTVEFTNIENDQEIVGKQNKNFTLEGKTEPKAKIYINDRFAYADEEGQFKFSLTLNEGDNHLKIKVVDPAGNIQETELNIKFKP